MLLHKVPVQNIHTNKSRKTKLLPKNVYSVSLQKIVNIKYLTYIYWCTVQKSVWQDYKQYKTRYFYFLKSHFYPVENISVFIVFFLKKKSFFSVSRFVIYFNCFIFRAEWVCQWREEKLKIYRRKGVGKMINHFHKTCSAKCLKREKKYGKFKYRKKEWMCVLTFVCVCSC